jgi:hypothetical protein
MNMNWGKKLLIRANRLIKSIEYGCLHFPMAP